MRGLRLPKLALAGVGEALEVFGADGELALALHLVFEGVAEGLEGVVAAQTRLSQVDGKAGQLIIAGFPLEEIAPQASFEEMVYLLWTGDLPNSRQLSEFREALAQNRSLPQAAMDLLMASAAAKINGMCSKQIMKLQIF